MRFLKTKCVYHLREVNMTQTQQKNNILEFPGSSEGAEVVKADTDEGYTRIANTLLEAVYRCDLTARQSRVLLAVIRKTYGFNRKMDWLSAPLIAEAINYTGDDSNVRKDIKALKDRNILISEGKKIGPNPVLSSWIFTKQVENNTGRKLPANRLKTTCKQVENNPVNRSKTTRTKDSIKDNKKNNTKDKAVFPEWLNQELFGDFVAMRKEIKKPMSDKAVILAIGKLEKLKAEGEDIDAVLEQSIFNTWQGLFAVKKPNQIVNQKPQPQGPARKQLFDPRAEQ